MDGIREQLKNLQSFLLNLFFLICFLTSPTFLATLSRMKTPPQISSLLFFFFLQQCLLCKCLVLNPLVSSRAIFSVLDLMKVDMANFAVSSIRPHLMQQSVEYERKQFQEFLEKQPSMFNVLWCLFVVCVFSFQSLCRLLQNDITVGCCKMIFSEQNENLIWEYVSAC